MNRTIGACAQVRNQIWGLSVVGMRFTFLTRSQDDHQARSGREQRPSARRADEQNAGTRDREANERQRTLLAPGAIGLRGARPHSLSGEWNRWDIQSHRRVTGPLRGAHGNGEGRPVTTGVFATSLTERILNRVEQHVGTDSVRRFLRDKSSISIEDESVVISAPTRFAAECIQRRFGGALKEAAAHETGTDASPIRIAVAPEMAVASPRVADAPASATSATKTNRWPASAPPPPSRRTTSRSDRGGALTLDTFVVGRCNQLAHRAALALTQHDRPLGFNIVFAHGECGVGKTHLLQGVMHRLRNEHPGARVLYTTGEAFTNAFITAIRGGDINAFRRKHRGLDLLCIDDIHFLSNKTQTQTEFLHTFDAMDLEGARIMLASDEHPGRIRQLSRELVSRFSAGMVVGLDAPDPVTRRRIILSLARRRSIALSEDAISVIAEHCTGSVREIEGALTRIDAVHRLLPEGKALSGTLDAASVRYALGPGRPRKARRPMKVEAIAECVADALGVTMPEMLGKSRHKRVVVARSIAAHLSRKLTSRSFPEIAQAMGRPNHSTVVTACKRVEQKIAAAEPCDADIDVVAETWGELADEMERRVRATLNAA